jgi:hypothetical protein
MIIAIPAIGVVLLLLLVAYLFFGSPQGTIRSLVITLINVLLFAIVVYFILSLFKVI